MVSHYSIIFDKEGKKPTTVSVFCQVVFVLNY